MPPNFKTASVLVRSICIVIACESYLIDWLCGLVRLRTVLLALHQCQPLRLRHLKLLDFAEETVVTTNIAQAAGRRSWSVLRPWQQA